jgi:catalase (peroxidase I)
LQQITLRFTNECGSSVFIGAARALHEQIVDAWEPESLPGYRTAWDKVMNLDRFDLA